jgi:YcaO-like protein with predicted kinase domain
VTGTAKRFRRGTHRSLEPEETLERVRPLMGPLGITRLSNVTGLDAVGIPVVIAYRPNARSNAVFQGKGLDLAAAKASALMEAVETACAERVPRPLQLATAADIRRDHALADWAGLPSAGGAVPFDEHTQTSWIEGRDLLAGGTAWVPFESVSTDYTVPAPRGSGYFLASSNGLASGNDTAEALVHGLCEVIERDAATVFDLRTAALQERRVDLASVDDPDCQALLDRFAAAALVVAVWDLTSDVGVPAFRCHVMERDDGPGLLPLPAEGQGCHPEPAVALCRALTEAAQGRVTAIVGVRDDIGPRFYGQPELPETLARWRALLMSVGWGRRFGEVTGRASATHEDDVDALLTRLRAAGVAQAVAVDLTPAWPFPACVVRVVVPGLEGLQHSRYLPSPRARARARLTRSPSDAWS